MKKLIRYLVIGVVAAIALLIAVTAIFMTLFDANEYKQDLSELVKQQTGRDLVFSGDVSLTFFPSLGLKLGEMSFANAKGFGTQPMIKINEASISVDIASIIAFNPQVDQLVLRDLEINLTKNKAGVTNWDDLVPKADDTSSASGSASGADKSSQSKAAEGDTPGQSRKITGVFAGIVLENAKLHWLDEQAGADYRVRDLDIYAGPISIDAPFPFKLHLEARGEGQFDTVLDFDADIQLLLESQRLTLENMQIGFNGADITGRIQVTNFEKPELVFALASEDIDVDALLSTTLIAVESDQVVEEPVVPTTEPAPDVQIALPMELLRELKIDGKLDFQKVKVQNLILSNVLVPIKADKGIIAINPLTLDTYSGKVEARVEVDVRRAVPYYRISESVNGVKVGALLLDFADVKIISGALNADAEITTHGEWLSELKRNSNGTLNLSFLDGAVKGFNIRHSIETAKAKIRKQTPPPKQDLKTDFSALKISGAIINGVFQSDDLDLQAPLLRVGGKGSADLNTDTVDYLVKAKLVRSVDGQDGGGADDLDGLLIPVKIYGPFTAPKIDIQLDEMLKGRLDAEKAKLQAEITRKKEELKAQLEAEKQALKQQLETEKQALVDAQKRELEQKRQVEEARIKAELEKKKEAAKKDLLKKLLD